MIYYHMTSTDNLASISALGLVPKNGENGKLIGEEKTKVYFSEGFAGAIALFVDFDIVFRSSKEKYPDTADEGMKERLSRATCLEEYLGEGVYLCFDGEGIENQRNFENGCTDMTVTPDRLCICVLRREGDGTSTASRFDVIRYMMAVTPLEDIRYYGVAYPGAPRFEDATARIQAKVGKYYSEHREEIDGYASGCEIDIVPLCEYMKRRETPAK